MLLLVLTACNTPSRNTTQTGNASEGLEISEFEKYCSVEGIGTCTDTDIVIPSEYNGKPVTEIAWYAFKECESIVSVVIPDGVTTIGYQAFSQCTALKSVTIADSVNRMDGSTFSDCTSLVTVKLSKNANFGWFDFSNCTSLVSIEIPDGVQEIGGFNGCTSLESIKIADSVREIDDSCFSRCTALKSIVLPKSLTILPNAIFEDCSNLESVTLPDALTEIRWRAFNNCSKLTTINLPNGLKQIGDSVFQNCASLPSVIIPDSVTNIGNDIFAGCTSLKSAVIGNGIESIPTRAFENCSSLENVVIPESVYSIGDSFENCVSLVTIEIPAATWIFNEDMFDGCHKLVEIVFNGDSKYITDSFYSKWIPYNILEVHAGTSKIDKQGDWWFYTVGDSNYLIDYRGNDTELVLPESYNGKTYAINYYLFYHHTDLTDVTLSQNVTKIARYAFFGCRGLTEIHYAGTMAQWEKIEFEASWGTLYSTTRYEGVEKIHCSNGTVSR